jgi:lysine 2,3-aminomutase
MPNEWQRFKIWKDVSAQEFEDSSWQDKNSIFRLPQLESLLAGVAPQALFSDIAAGVQKSGMSVRLSPYIVSLIDWSNIETDRIRRQFLPLASEMESNHPCLVLDSLEETSHSPVDSLVHRYPDKVLFLVTSVCPVYCQYCTRSYAVGMDTATVQKEHVISAKNWTAALEYIRGHSEIEDIVISGGDVSRLKAANITELGAALLDAVLRLINRGRDLFKDVCVHTHFNHPSEVTPQVEKAMRRLHSAGVVVRNQTVLLRGVNDDSTTLRSLFKRLGAVNIHPYYVYLCDMVKGTEHFRVSLALAQTLEKEVRGATAGFNTPLFIVDTPAGKRDVHSAEFYDRVYGVSFFASPLVAPGRRFNYFDPLRTLTAKASTQWRVRPREEVLARVQITPPGHTHSRRRRTDPPVQLTA